MAQHLICENFNTERFINNMFVKSTSNLPNIQGTEVGRESGHLQRWIDVEFCTLLHMAIAVL